MVQAVGTAVKKSRGTNRRMEWKGKFIGGVLGAIGAGPIGAALGVLLGHQYDRQVEYDDEAGGDPQLVSAVFFRTTFAVMGFIAKADGRVSESEIQAARGVMQQLRLSPEQVQAAIRFFTEGKQPAFDLERTVRELRRACGRRHDLLGMFLELQLRAALLGSDLRGPARSHIQRVGHWLGVSGIELAHLEAVLRLQYRYARGESAPPPADRLADAYRVLDVSSNGSNAEIVKAYRRQMSRHHPDKLVANGLPESMMEIAKQKTQQIREAYEIICAHRGIK
jgi:DnaJ like chaperone protein